MDGSPGRADGDFLAMLAPAARDRLLKGSTRHVYPAGSVFYRPGAGARVIVVNSGLVRLYFEDPDGRQASVLYGAKGSLIGIINVFGLIPDLNAQAVIETVTIDVDLNTFQDLIAEDVATAASVAKYLAVRLRKTLQLVTVRSLGNIRERLAYDLLERARMESEEPGPLCVRATQAELADAIGTSREVATRNLAALRAEGIIATDRKLIRIVEPIRLATIVRGLIT